MLDTDSRRHFIFRATLDKVVAKLWRRMPTETIRYANKTYKYVRIPQARQRQYLFVLIDKRLPKYHDHIAHEVLHRLKLKHKCRSGDMATAKSFKQFAEGLSSEPMIEFVAQRVKKLYPLEFTALMLSTQVLEVATTMQQAYKKSLDDALTFKACTFSIDELEAIARSILGVAIAENLLKYKHAQINVRRGRPTIEIDLELSNDNLLQKLVADRYGYRKDGTADVTGQELYAAIADAGMDQKAMINYLLSVEDLASRKFAATFVENPLVALLDPDPLIRRIVEVRLGKKEAVTENPYEPQQGRLR